MTHRKLETSNTLKQLVVSFKSPAVWKTDDNFYINEATEKLVGYTNQELPDIHRWFQKLYPSDWEQVYRYYLESKAKKFQTPFESVITAKDGSLKHVEFTRHVTENQEIWWIRDHTELKEIQSQNAFEIRNLNTAMLEVRRLQKKIKTENVKLKKSNKELKKSQQKYRQIYLATNTPVLNLDLDLNVVNVNQAFRNTFQYTENSSISTPQNPKKIWEVLGNETLNSEIEEHIKNHKHHNAEIFECSTQLGELVLVQLNVYALSDVGDTESYQIVITDLTDKIMQDQANYQKEKLELMEKMARIVAHEVRNPLTNIILSSEQLAPVIPDDKKLYADIIKRNSNRIELLIRKFLNTFKNVQLEKEVSNIYSLLSECETAMQDNAKLLEVEIINEVSNDLPHIPLDREKIKLVFTNLINNAIQACQETKNAQIRLTAHQDDSYMTVSVADNGTGIAEDDLKQLFEPFFTKKQSGLGLGLTTSLNILRSHNGKIAVKNNEQGGATFKVSIPFLFES